MRMIKNDDVKGEGCKKMKMIKDEDDKDDNDKG